MRLVADIPEYIVTRVRDTMKTGGYSSFESFLITALENQLVLENGDNGSVGLASPTTVNVSIGNEQAGGMRGAPDLLAMPRPGSTKTVSPPSFKELEMWGSPKDEAQLWMWGQINKLLPIKVALRSIINIAGPEDDWSELGVIYEKSGKMARAFGLQLLERDERAGNLHGNKLSAAFPIGKSSDKSCWRFCSQFVGYIRKDGRLAGGLPFLRFARLRRDNKGKEWIGVTQAGVEFAGIENPILDVKGEQPSRSFGIDEVKYYWRHIKQNIPGEFAAFKLILQLIADGISEREKINKAMRPNVDKGWSDKVLNTQRAGVMSRLYELGLIDKEKNGVSVTYGVAPLGAQLLKL